MKITKTQLIKVIKEELEEVVAKSTELTLARDAARPPDPIGPVEAHAVAKVLGDLGFTLTHEGLNQFTDFLAELETSGHLRRMQ
jgi:hypothetical protein